MRPPALARSLSLLSQRSFQAPRALNQTWTPLQGRRTPKWLSRAETLERIDDHIRSHFPEEPVEVVEEVVRARNEIWGGLHSRKPTEPSHLTAGLTG